MKSQRLEAGPLLEKFSLAYPWITYSWLSRYSRNPHPVLRHLRPNRPSQWKLNVRPSKRICSGPKPNEYAVADVHAIVHFAKRQGKLLEKFYTRDSARRAGIKLHTYGNLEAVPGARHTIYLFHFAIPIRCELWHDSKDRWQPMWFYSRPEVDAAHAWDQSTKRGNNFSHTEGNRVHLPESVLLARLNKSASRKVTHGWLMGATKDGHIARFPIDANHRRNPHGTQLFVYDYGQAVEHHKLTMRANGEHPRTAGVFAPYPRPTQAPHHGEILERIDKRTERIDRTSETTLDMIMVNGVERPKGDAMPREPERRGGAPRVSANAENKRINILRKWKIQSESGKSRKDFCKDEGISEKTLIGYQSWNTMRQKRANPLVNKPPVK